MPESDGNPIAESDKFFFASIVESDKFLAIVKSYGNPIAESDKLVTQRPRAKRKAKG